ncbi:MAG: hypothetical protein ABIJ08_05060 [Nanoarchaeota archaeon]
MKKVIIEKFRKKCEKCNKIFFYHVIYSGFNEYNVPHTFYSEKCGQFVFANPSEDKFFRHIIDYFSDKYDKRFIGSEGRLIEKNVFEAFLKTIDDPNNCSYRTSNEICPTCGNNCTTGESWKDERVDKLEVPVIWVTHNKIKSLEDIKDPELKEIFKDFEFSRLNKQEAKQ